MSVISSSGRGGRLPLKPFVLFLFLCFETNCFISGSITQLQCSCDTFPTEPRVFGPRKYTMAYKYSTLPRGISINVAPKVGMFPEAEGRGKYSLPRVQYYRYSTRKG